jgi:hypothetical protein
MVIDLIEKIRNDDHQALYSLYSKYKQPFIRYCLKEHPFRRNKRDIKDIEAIYHETFLTFRHNSISGKIDFMEDEEIRTYIFLIGLNNIRNYFADQKEKDLAEASFFIEEEETPFLIDFDEPISNSVRELLESGFIGEICVKTLLYSYYYGFSTRIIKERIGFMTENIVVKQTERCMYKLRELLSLDVKKQ